MRFIFAIFLSSFSNSLAQAQGVLTQTVGTAAFQVVTTREVKALELISRALEKEMKDSALQISQDNASRTLFELAIYRESQILSAITVEPEELKSLVSSVKNKLQKNSDWKKLDVTDEELKTWVERKKIASDYLKLKGSSLTAIVTDQEIQDYYDKNRVKFGSTPIGDQRSNIRLFLQKESQQKRIQEWLNALKIKYQIRNDLADLGVEKSMDLDTQQKPESKLEQRPEQQSELKVDKKNPIRK